jgi:hypothetical protein
MNQIVGSSGAVQDTYYDISQGNNKTLSLVVPTISVKKNYISWQKNIEGLKEKNAAHGLSTPFSIVHWDVYLPARAPGNDGQTKGMETYVWRVH